MQTTPTIEPTGSPVPGVIPEPLSVHQDTVAADGGRSGTLPASPPGRRTLASSVPAKLLSAIRGDKYMVDAYPPAWHGAVAVRAGVASEPDAAAASPPKER